MKISYDSKYDLLYVNFASENVKSHRTETIAPGVHIDFDKHGNVIGLELLEASTAIGSQPLVEVELSSAGR